MYTENASNVGLVILFYLAVTFLFAWVSGRKNAQGSFMEEYFVGGRSTGPWVLALTWVATMSSGGIYIGVPALAHTFGWILLLWICGNMMVATVSFGVLARRVSELGRKTGALTVPDLLRDRFQSPAIALCSSVLIIVLQLAFMVAQYAAGARIIEAVIGLPYHWGVIGFSVSVALYTAWGGFRAVAWTDSFQALVMLLGIAIVAWFVVDKAGGMEMLSNSLAAQSSDLVSGPGPDNFLPLAGALSFFMLMPLATMGHPALVSRFLTFTGSAVLKRAAFLAGIYVLLLYPLIIIVGIGGRVLVPELDAPDHAFIATVLVAVPTLLAGIVLAAPVSAIMSTLSSYLLVCSGTIVRDIYQRNFCPDLPDQRARSYVTMATILIATIGTVLALKPPQFLQLIVVFAGTGLGATFTWPIILAIFWPRMNKYGGLAGMTVGFSTIVIQYLAMGDVSFYGFHPFVWSFLLSLLACIAGSLAMPKQAAEHLAIYFDDHKIPTEPVGSDHAPSHIKIGESHELNQN
jgi:SSS family transporter